MKKLLEKISFLESLICKILLTKLSEKEKLEIIEKILLEKK